MLVQIGMMIASKKDIKPIIMRIEERVFRMPKNPWPKERD